MTCAEVTKYFPNGSREGLLLPQRSQCRLNSRPARLSASSALSFGSIFSVCFRSSVYVHVTLPLSRTALRQGVRKGRASSSGGRVRCHTRLGNEASSFMPCSQEKSRGGGSGRASTTGRSYVGSGRPAGMVASTTGTTVRLFHSSHMFHTSSFFVCYFAIYSALSNG